MVKNKFLFILTAVLYTARVYSQQVGINTDNPDASAALQVVATNNDKGVLIPSLTKDEIDAFPNKMDGVTVYNKTESCFNYWDGVNNEWQSLCGGVAKAVFTLPNGCSDITVNGTYVQGSALNSSNYLSIKVDVTKAGSYTINASTPNGYGFSTQGTFLNTGEQTVIVSGQGKPAAANQTPGDAVSVSLTGTDSGCSTLTIPVLPPTATFSISCASAKANGAYVKSQVLTSANTITVNVTVDDVSAGGSWSITSNTVDGISFKGSGVFTAEQVGTVVSVTLQGSGTPTSTADKVLTLTTNSNGGSATCSVTVQMAVPKMTVLGLGTADQITYGYVPFTTTAATSTSSMRKLAFAAANFGTLDNSTVKFLGWNIDPVGNNTTNYTNVANDLLGNNPPDIVFIGYN
jgi:hypothetical protein